MQKNAHLPVALGYIPTTNLFDGHIYTGGGSTWEGTAIHDSNNSFIYDPVADSISTIASVPRSHGRDPSDCLRSDWWHRLSDVGHGRRERRDPSNEVDGYDRISHFWSGWFPFITPRRNFATDGELFCYIYIAGGYASDGVTLELDGNLLLPGSHTNSDSYIHTNADSDSHSHADCNSDCNCNPNAYCYSNCDSYSKTNTDSETYTATTTAPYATAAPVTIYEKESTVLNSDIASRAREEFRRSLLPAVASAKAGSCICATRIWLALFCSVSMSAYAATITVTNTNDSGPGSLRQALADANDGDTINFAVTGTIGLTSGELFVAKSITISGPGAENLAVNGNAKRPYSTSLGQRHDFWPDHHQREHHRSHGGGIYNDHATLTVNNCTINGNRVAESTTTRQTRVAHCWR